MEKVHGLFIGTHPRILVCVFLAIGCHIFWKRASRVRDQVQGLCSIEAPSAHTARLTRHVHVCQTVGILNFDNNTSYLIHPQLQPSNFPTNALATQKNRQTFQIWPMRARRANIHDSCCFFFLSLLCSCHKSDVYKRTALYFKITTMFDEETKKTRNIY